jgi:hypothetical protein
MTNSQTAAIDPALLSYIDKIVTEKVAEQTGAARQQREPQAMREEENADRSNRAAIVVFSSDMDKRSGD